MQRLMYRVFCMGALASGLTVAAFGADGPAVKSSVSKPQLRAALSSPRVLLASEIPAAQLKPLPLNLPMRMAGSTTQQGGVAGGETIVYSNLNGTTFFAPDTGTLIADDLRMIAPQGCDLSRVSVGVFGGGDGTGPGFSVTMALYDGCPSTGGSIIAGTEHAEDLTDDGVWLVTLDLSSAEVTVPGQLWLGMTFSNSAAGWIFDTETTIGSSEDTFDHPDFPCSAFFGGCDGPTGCANFFAELACTGEFLTEFLAYRAQTVPPAPEPVPFTELGFNTLNADDIAPITEICEISGLVADVVGLNGVFRLNTEFWTNDLGPGVPILGTDRLFSGQGNQTLETMQFVYPPGINIGPISWLVYSVNRLDTGPVLVTDNPDVGVSQDAFGVFDGSIWGFFFFGGCPTPTFNPCATWRAKTFCYGEAVHACCLEAGVCENLTEFDCTELGGTWNVGEFCDPNGFLCGFAACASDPVAGGEGDCFTAHGTNCSLSGIPCVTSGDCEVGETCDTQPGCDESSCCNIVCEIDAFCCTDQWDSACAGAADLNCPMVPENDTCLTSITVDANSTSFVNNILATETEEEPGFCCHNGSRNEKGFGSVWFDFVATETTARINTCASQAPADDSLLQVFATNVAGEPCDALTVVACNDDTPGCGPIDFNSDICVQGLDVGSTYFIQLSSWTVDDLGAYILTVESPCFTFPPETLCPTCPVGEVSWVDPPDGVVDARQPHPLNDLTPQGIQTIIVSAPQGADDACFEICENDPGVESNLIADVMDNGDGTYTLTLDRPITPGAVTTITYNDEEGGTFTCRYTSHPGNVNGDTGTAAPDIIAMVNCLNNGGQTGPDCPFGLYSLDADHSDQANGADIVRVIDLLNGASLYNPWLNTELPVNTSCP